MSYIVNDLDLQDFFNQSGIKKLEQKSLQLKYFVNLLKTELLKKDPVTEIDYTQLFWIIKYLAAYDYDTNFKIEIGEIHKVVTRDILEESNLDKLLKKFKRDQPLSMKYMTVTFV